LEGTLRATEYSEKTVLDLVANIYQAAGNPQVWPVFLELYAEAVRGEYTLLVAHDFSAQRATVNSAVRFDPALLREYEQHYAALNESVRRGGSRMFHAGQGNGWRRSVSRGGADAD
jgi:hypothetical protein